MVAAARGWVGTPFRHQAATKGAGCDCVGLIRGVAEELGISPLGADEWCRIGGYGRLPRPDRMGALIERWLVPADTPLPGDIAWMAWRQGRPMHMAFLAEIGGRRTIIHAWAGVERVTEHGLSGEWPGRVHSWWRLPALVAA